MRTRSLVWWVAVVIVLVAVWRVFPDPLPSLLAGAGPVGGPTGQKGYQGCARCHEAFVSSWSSSPHGLSFREYSGDDLKGRGAPLEGDVRSEQSAWRVDIRPGKGVVAEKAGFLMGGRTWKIAYLVGVKREVYLLAKADRGYLEVLPVVYDVKRRTWKDLSKTVISHALGDVSRKEGQRIVFASSCRTCHIGPDPRHYDLRTDSYAEPPSSRGITCEACHGSTSMHEAAVKDSPAGRAPGDIGITSMRGLPALRRNDVCASCHIASRPITQAYVPGEAYLDHFEPAAMEAAEINPDGKPIFGNTFVNEWLINPCAASRRLECLQCHTAGGTSRIPDSDRANRTCLACHPQMAGNIQAHTHHSKESPGSVCIACHMAALGTGRDVKPDHSVLPPMPTLSSLYRTPNGCIACHYDKDDDWAQGWVRTWYKKDYQAPYLDRANLVREARHRNFSRIDDMLAFVRAAGPVHEFHAASMVRLMASWPDPAKVRVLVEAVRKGGPLVRAASAEALVSPLTANAIDALFAASDDPVRLVRIKAASSLLRHFNVALGPDKAKVLAGARGEYITSLMVRPDLYTSHVAMGAYFLEQKDVRSALMSFAAASKLDPLAAEPHVNASIAYAVVEKWEEAEAELTEALRLDPHNAPALFNMGLLRNQQARQDEAVSYLKEALRYDPMMAQAAYNLAVILSGKDLKEAIEWARRAYELWPDDKYGYTLALYCKKEGLWNEAIETLNGVIAKYPSHTDSYLVLGEIYEKKGKPLEAAEIYRKGLKAPGILDADRARIEKALRRLE